MLLQFRVGACASGTCRLPIPPPLFTLAPGASPLVMRFKDKSQAQLWPVLVGTVQVSTGRRGHPGFSRCLCLFLFLASLRGRMGRGGWGFPPGPLFTCSEVCSCEEQSSFPAFMLKAGLGRTHLVRCGQTGVGGVEAVPAELTLGEGLR